MLSTLPYHLPFGHSSLFSLLNDTNYIMSGDSNEKEREIRVLVITMGGPRQGAIEEMLSEIGGFAKPVFSPGVRSRRIRNRCGLFRACHQAGILPPEEWEKIRQHVDVGDEDDEDDVNGKDKNSPAALPNGRGFFDCLEGVPISPDRRGSPADVKLHYCDELWRKVKTINRGRSVLGCILAHLIAMKTFVDDGGFDVLLEDNVRAPLNGEAARRIRQTIEAARECESTTGKVHMKYFGWLGSMLNLQWTFQSHLIARRLGNKRVDDNKGNGNDTMTRLAEESDCFVAMFPTTQHVEEDLESGRYVVDDNDTNASTPEMTSPLGDFKVHSKPGGTPVWGAYAYWVSKEAHEAVLDLLRKDIGAMLWKPKSARFYTVKPIDKILPRQTFATFGLASVVISSQPAFFRAPMLTSKIHSKFDPEFCKSTEYQLAQTDLTWNSLWLTDSERLVVEHHEKTNEWLSPVQLGDPSTKDCVDETSNVEKERG